MQSASLEVRFSTPGLSEHRRALSDLKRESKDAADSTRSMVAEMTASIDRLSNARRKQTDTERLLREARIETRNGATQDAADARIRIRAMEAEIEATKRLVDSKRNAQSIINSYNKDQSSVAKSRSGYENFWTKSLNERERDEKASEARLLADWLKAKDSRASEVATAERIQSDARLRRFNEEKLTNERAEKEAIASSKRAASDKIAADREITRATNASIAERKRAEKEAIAQKKRDDAEYTSWWKTQLKEQDRAAKESAKEKAKADKELAAANKASANQPSILDKAALWVTGLNQAISLASKLAGIAGSFVLDAAKWESMTMALENMDGGAANAAVAISHLYEIAKAPGLSLETAEHAYIKLRAVGIAGSDAERVIKDFSNTVARGGGGSVQFGRVLEQFVQMRGENRVLQQDLKFMKNSMPELASLMEKAFGTTTAAGIRKLGLNARQFTDGLLTEMEKLPKAQQTLTSEIENTQTAWSRLKAAMVDTDLVKSKLKSLTGVLESLRTAIAGSPREKEEAAINAKYDTQINTVKGYKSSPAKMIMAKLYHNDQEEAILGSEEGKGRLVGSLEKERRAELAAIALRYGDAKKAEADRKKIEEDIKKEKAASDAEKAADAAKKAADKRAQELKELAKQLETNRAKLDAEKAYQKTLDDMKAQGFTEADARIEADAEKKTTEAVALWEKQKQTAGAGSKLLTEINSQHKQAIIQIRHEANEKLGENYRKRQEIEAKDIDDLKKKIEDKRKAIEDAEIKLQEMKEAEKTKWQIRADEIQSQYADEITQIEEQANTKLEILRIAGRKTVELEERINQERRNKENEYYTSRMKVGLDGTSSLFGALAEMEMARVDKMSATYKTMFAIQKSFSIASATVDVVSAAAKALNDWSAASTFERIALAGGIMTAGGGLISQITSTAYAGVFDKGGDIPYGSFGVAGENGPEIVKGPAHVTSTKDTARMLAGAGRAPVVNVYNNAGANVEAKVNSDGSIDLLIDRVVAAAEGRIASGITSGNGSVDRSLRSTYGLGRGK